MVNGKYKDLDVLIPKEARAEINDKILTIVGTGKSQGITREDIFNSYTGVGGLHGLSKNDFDNFHEYSEAKKDKEQGQFFTPHSICREIAELINPNPKDLVADISCGIGNFFNYFQEENCFGCELDSKAVSVADYLYPNATIKCEDFKYFKLDAKVDYVLGNPPFNIWMNHADTGDSIKSQYYFFKKSAEIMKRGGLILAVVPSSFLADEFFNKSDIEGIEEDFSFIGQYSIDVDAFKSLGVKNFATKVMCWQRRAEAIEHQEYVPTEFISHTVLKERITKCLKNKEALRLQLHRELLNDEDKEFEYKVKKYVFEIRHHKPLQKYENKALAYINKYRTQKCPEKMDYETWYKKHRITKPMVISYLKRTIAKQNYKPIDDVKFVKFNYGVKLKAYSNKEKRKLNKRNQTVWYFNRVCTGLDSIQTTPIPPQYKRLFDRKTSAYRLQNTPLKELDKCPEIANYLRRFYFIDKEGKKCHFNKVQRTDLGMLLQKDYSILAWQMGGGKTAGAYAWSRWKRQRNTFIVSASLAINLTWKPFLTTNGESFVIVKTLKDLYSIKDGDYILLSFHFISKYSRRIKKFIRMNSQKVNLVFDESDEITNNKSRRTKSVLNIFRRCKRKFLTTGTTTRNNIGELYSQIELLYNNSMNMMSWSPFYYVEEKPKGEATRIKRKDNKYWNEPFPAYYGQTMFRRCFNPTKSTVFGIGKQNQDIYNEQDLREIIEKTIITRKFREIAGDKYEVETILVHQDNSERQVYRTIINELDKIIPDYFNLTGNSRKDALLKLMRQLTLLIEATSTPQMFNFYRGSGTPNKAKKIFEMVEDLWDDKVAIGCTSKKAAKWYYEEIQDFDRPSFYIDGDVTFKRREVILKEFEATENGILVCTQQSLKSSVNIPSCDKVIVESLQWNIPKIEQFYFRFIRYNSKNKTQVYFVNYEGTIEVNLLALLMAKERLNDYVKTLEYKEDSDIYDEYDIDLDILNGLITKQKDEDGKVQINWGEAQVVN